MGCRWVAVTNSPSWLAECVIFLQIAWYRCLWVTSAVRELGVLSPQTSPGAILLSKSDWLLQLTMVSVTQMHQSSGPMLTLLEVQFVVWCAL